MALNGTAIRLTKSSALLTAAPFTFAAWVYLNNVTAAPGVFCIQNAGGTSYFQIWLGGTTYKANAEAGNAGTAGTAIATLTLVASTWYHMCAVFTSATSRTMYVNAANNASEHDQRHPDRSHHDPYRLRLRRNHLLRHDRSHRRSGLLERCAYRCGNHRALHAPSQPSAGAAQRPRGVCPASRGFTRAGLVLFNGLDRYRFTDIHS
jgi:hypothetical protein